MKFFYEFERRFNRYAIPNLMYYIVILYAVGLAVYVVNPVMYWSIYGNYLCLDGRALLHGQIWRLATFLIFWLVPVYQCVFWDHCSVYVPQPGSDSGKCVGFVPV